MVKDNNAWLVVACGIANGQANPIIKRYVYTYSKLQFNDSWISLLLDLLINPV